MEGFADAVFAFALTLLVVSLEVPNTFDELLATMRGFFAFAISGWLLYSVWFDHYMFFRRYGLQDTLTMNLSSVLLFVVLFYVYPLKFLFTALMDQLLGFSIQVGSSTGDVVETIRAEQWPLLLVLFGVGFVVVQLVFFLLYWRAYALREMLKLDAYEASITRQEIQGHLLLAGVGLSSVAIALLGGEAAISWAGWVYLLSWPLMTMHGYVMARRRRQSASLP
ncbi:MAG: TMEM175 family protein [Actinomycetota bacterium]|nr:TMEM175 family protein [Actinomycetota bacterium]